MLLPALNQVKQKAFTIQCMSNEKQILQAFLQYSMENKDWLCPVKAPGGAIWTRKIYHILQPSYDLDMPKDYKGKLPIAICPAEKAPIGSSGDGRFSYGHYLGNAHSLGYADSETNYPYHKLSRLKKASSVVLIGDNDRKNLYFTSSGASGTLKNPGTSFAFRHGKDSANFGYADGHSDTLSWLSISRMAQSVNPASNFLNNGVNEILLK